MKQSKNKMRVHFKSSGNLYLSKSVPHLIFSGGEVHVNCIVPDGAISATIYCYARESDDIMAIVMLASILKSAELPVTLILPYVPYARQDRVCSVGDAFALKSFASIINSLDFVSVEVHDPHSFVAANVIERCVVIQQRYLISFDEPFDCSPFMLVSPDKGALVKIRDAADFYEIPNANIVVANKVRDPSTGDIVATTVDCGDLGGMDCVILDDICDGGRTFIELAKVLKEKGAGDITLKVTHGIFSKGKSVFDGLIDNVTATYDWTEM